MNDGISALDKALGKVKGQIMVMTAEKMAMMAKLKGYDLDINDYALQPDDLVEISSDGSFRVFGTERFLDD